MLSTMGRPREHDANTAVALLDAAERIVLADGLEALTVRRVASEVGTTTRAVYSVFSSKEGLVVALGRRAFELLGDGLASFPQTDDPAADLVEGTIAVFRGFAIEHPTLFQIALHRPPSPQIKAGFRDAQAEALAGLEARIERLHASGLLGGQPVWAVLCAFDALCEGLAALELRGILRLQRSDAVAATGDGIEEQIWRDALTALVRGFAVTDVA